MPIAFLLDKNQQGAREIVHSLSGAIESIQRCEECRMLTSQKLCNVCMDVKRDSSCICVVESPADYLAIENTGGFSGKYFVLMGRLSPMDDIGPEDLGIDKLLELIRGKDIQEVILATSATIEGQTTAFYIQDSLKNTNVKISKLAQGLPVGGEIETSDDGTLISAFKNRRDL